MLIRRASGILHKPPLGSEVAYGHPLARNLAGAWLFNERAGAHAVNIAKRDDSGVWSGSPPVGKWAPGGASFGGTEIVTSTVSNDDGITSQCTQIVWAFPADTTVGQYLIDHTASGLGDNYRCTLLGFQSGFWNVFNNIAYPTGNAADTQMAADARRWQMVAYGSDGTTLKGWRDGVKIISVAANLTPSGQLTTTYIGGDVTISSAAYTGYIGLVLRYTRMLGDDEILALHRDPYAFTRPRVRRRYLHVAAAAGGSPQNLSATAPTVTVSAPTATLLAGLAALAAAACSVSVSAAAATLIPGGASIAATSPAVTVSAPTATLVPGVATMTATSPTVTVSAPSAALIQPGQLAGTPATVAVSAPAAQLHAGVATITATAAVVTVSAPAAAIAATVTLGSTSPTVTVSAPAAARLATVTLPAGAAVVTVSAPVASLAQGATTLSASACIVTVSAPNAALVLLNQRINIVRGRVVSLNPVRTVVAV